jgi:hypothetical protein
VKKAKVEKKDGVLIKFGDGLTWFNNINNQFRI